MIPTLPVQVGCPKCGAQYVAQLQSVIDVGKQPQLKAALLRGTLFFVRCSRPREHTTALPRSR